MTDRSDTDIEYFAELTAALRSRGRPREEVSATVDDLSGYLAETGTSAQEEFGPVDVFAERLTAAEDGPAAGQGTEPRTWKWIADIYADRRQLNHFGDQGWEIERIDRLGRFVARRDPATAMRWEYRREVVNAADRTAKAAELAPDGWELCGHCLYLMYFKRPKAASAGPAADLAELPEVPHQKIFLRNRAQRGKLLLALLSAVVSGTVVSLAVQHGASVTPILIAALLAGVVGGGTAWYGVKRDAVGQVED
ncbi:MULTISPECIES: hypothetical protein [unclassified Streptomyces]|uniref:hypothetical protein n=1 Tax=unclassified Streptomyces TaxID=2593676 RepID=UPI002DD8597E|nr:hypothetical protein [Streptomyces sp. NBC_01766]WSC19647.1 hypothetical protein OIE60_08080 [Streptomyces sp. NBC_01766]